MERRASSIAVAGLSLLAAPAVAKDMPARSPSEEKANVKSCSSGGDTFLTQIKACDIALTRALESTSRLKILVFRSIAKRKAGDFEGAIADADAAIENPVVRKQSSNWWRGAQHERCLARATANQDLDNARTICAGLLAEAPWEMEVMATDALLSLRRGDWERAANEYKLLARVYKDDFMPRYGNLLARAGYAYAKNEALDAELVSGLSDPKFAQSRESFANLGLSVEDLKSRAGRGK